MKIETVEYSLGPNAPTTEWASYDGAKAHTLLSKAMLVLAYADQDILEYCTMVQAHNLGDEWQYRGVECYVSALVNDSLLLMAYPDQLLITVVGEIAYTYDLGAVLQHLLASYDLTL